MKNYLTEIVFAGNELWRLLLFFGVVLSFLIIGRLISFMAMRFSKKPGVTQRELIKVAIAALARPIQLVFLTAGIWCVLHWNILLLPHPLQMLLETVFDILKACAVGYALYSAVDVADHYFNKLVKGTESKLDDILIPLVGRSARILVAVMVILNVATLVSGKNVMTLVAGLGVGGIAVALAAQDTIRNFFGSLVILGDKPFEIGDRIEIHGNDGIVEAVGFRSTRIRRLDGHLLTIPNSEIVNETVRNISERPYIKRVLNIGVTYDTDPTKVTQAIEILKEILKDHKGMNRDYPPRVYFNEFKDFSLDIMAIYWYHPPEYWDYMEFSEWVNMEILKRFNSAKIEFAFPSQTMYLANNGERQLGVNIVADNSDV
ncbi:MAG: mechanosensitive ion channel family protein [Kiritimatiellae bacterium]|nr:mechanosensitive ion channel family protein [Kiritimatiellia bacterium]